jgi:hypothetical protein
MVVVWRGRGYLVPLAIIANLALTALIASALGFRDATIQTYALEFFLAVVLFIPLWVYGKKWNSERRELIDKATGKEFVIGNHHRFFWMPMQYWTVIYPVVLLLIFLVST